LSDELGLAEVFSTLTAGELAEIAERASEQADQLRAGQGDHNRPWTLVYDYVAASARYSLATLTSSSS
jgi:hypothetical protein